MLDDDIVTVPAGWYPDPMGLPQLRWWDNYAWTEFTSAARSPLVMQDEPKLAYADDDLPSRRSQREQRDRTQGGDARRRTANSADLASTLRQLEPPKPQNVERSQPAPNIADTAAQSSTTQPSTPQPSTTQNSYPSTPEPQATASAPTADFDPFAEFLAEPNPAPSQPESTSVGNDQAGTNSAPAGHGSASAGFTQRDNANQDFGQQASYDQSAGYANPAGYADPHDYAEPQRDPGFSQPQPAQQFTQQQDHRREQFGAGQYGTDQYGSAQPGSERGRRQYDYAQARNGLNTPLAYTPFVWIIAMFPLIQLVGILLVVSAVDVSIALPFLTVIVAAPYVITIPLALADRRQLLRMGHKHPAHWIWSVLTAPVYLIVRAIAASREHGKGLTPLLIWASLSLLQVASIIAVPGILISAMPAAFSAEVQESIEADSAIAGRELSVTCPATPPVQIGGTFNCTGVLAETGEEVGIVVRLERANGWIDWRVFGMVWETAADAPAAEASATDGEPVTES